MLRSVVLAGWRTVMFLELLAYGLKSAGGTVDSSARHTAALLCLTSYLV